MVGVGSYDGAVREHELGGDDVVDRQAVLAGEEADAAGRRQSADAHVSVVARAHRKAEGRELLRDVAPARTGAQPHPSGGPIEHLDPVERADIDDDAAVVRRAAADAVSSAAHGEGHVLLTCEGERGDDIVNGRGLDDESRRSHARVHRAHLAVAAVARLDRHARERVWQGVVVDPVPALRQGGGPAGRSDTPAASAARARDRLPQRRRDVVPVGLDRAGVVPYDQERAEPVLDDEREEVLHPLLGRALEEASARRAEVALDVDESADLPRIASSGHGGLVDGPVGGPERVE